MQRNLPLCFQHYLYKSPTFPINFYNKVDISLSLNDEIFLCGIESKLLLSGNILRIFLFIFGTGRGGAMHLGHKFSIDTNYVSKRKKNDTVL